jgi:hypothetical protein
VLLGLGWVSPSSLSSSKREEREGREEAAKERDSGAVCCLKKQGLPCALPPPPPPVCDASCVSPAAGSPLSTVSHASARAGLASRATFRFHRHRLLGW